MKFVEKVVRKMNRRTILIVFMGAMLGGVLIAMPIGLIWPCILPISIGLLEEIHVVLVGTKLLQKVSAL